jgi:hypothetical protein
VKVADPFFERRAAVVNDGGLAAPRLSPRLEAPVGP